MKQRQRVAIYGGTFDPVHRGHLEIARRILTLFDIDKCLFVPARVAPHKLKQEVSPVLHRYAMLALATKDDPKLQISTVEIDGPGTRYTVDTLAHFRTQLGDSAEIFFVLGADSWMEITSWREWQRLTTLATLIVVSRPGYELASAQADFGTASRSMDLQGLTTEECAKAIATTGAQIFLSDVVMTDVSATEIRGAASQADFATLRGLVPPEVAEYIRKYQLYRNTHDGKFNG